MILCDTSCTRPVSYWLAYVTGYGSNGRPFGTTWNVMVTMGGAVRCGAVRCDAVMVGGCGDGERLEGWGP
jgi:hypothetical protein